MSDTTRIETAAVEARVARERLLATAHELQGRLAPSVLAEEAAAGVKAGASELVSNAGDAARRHPGATAGIAALVGMLLFRRPLRRLRKRIFGRRKATRKRDYR